MSDDQPVIGLSRPVEAPQSDAAPQEAPESGSDIAHALLVAAGLIGIRTVERDEALRLLAEAETDIETMVVAHDRVTAERDRARDLAALLEEKLEDARTGSSWIRDLDPADDEGLS